MSPEQQHLYSAQEKWCAQELRGDRTCHKLVNDFVVELIAYCFLMHFSEEMSRLAARKYARIIQKLGFNVRIFEG